MQAQCGSYKMGALTLTIRQCSRSYAGGSCRARLATVILFQLPVTLRLTTLFHTSYCLPPVSVACYIPLLPGPTSCIYRGLSAIQNKQSSYTAYLVQQQVVEHDWLWLPCCLTVEHSSAIFTLFQLPVTLRLTTLFHILYCLPPVSVACYILLLPGPTSCIYSLFSS